MAADGTEKETRARLIDRQLEGAKWNLADSTQVLREVCLADYDARPSPGVTDYSLLDETAQTVSIVEAKRYSRDAREGEEQLGQYVRRVAEQQDYAPFGFMANGRKIYFWDVDRAHPRLVAGFFTSKDLKRLLYIKRHQVPLASLPINNAIVDRPYQHEAIRRVAECFAGGKRRALLVMATGTGKTRVIMALTDLFLRADQARHILFLADRDTLVEQALTDGFKAHLPNEPRDRIYTHTIDQTKRLFVATEQTMSLCYRKFSPGFFDLIILDESHRSIFNRFIEVMDYFDERLIGLTATPADFIDRDTFRTFECANHTPTYLYDFKDAVKEKYLVDFSLYQAQTGFQRTGIKGADLSEDDRAALIANGIDPDNVDFSGTEIEVLVTNKDTLRKQWEEIMEHVLKDRSGQLPGKTIIFAMTQDHARRIRDAFEEMYPQHVGLVQVITSSMERVHDGTYGDGLISKFKKQDKPRIAISVDMLDTGVDIPEVVNLVFMRPVYSRIKLWQMIGRGTRNHQACRFHDWLPEGRKTEFKVMDFWQNDFKREPDAKTPQTLPVLVTIFNLRLQLLETVLTTPQAPAHVQAVADLRAMIARIPLDSVPVQKVYDAVESAWQDEFWRFPTTDKVVFLRNLVGPLLRFAPNVDLAAELFTQKVERLKLQILKGAPVAQTLQAIADDVSRLPNYVFDNAALGPSLDLCRSLERLPKASVAELTQVIRDLAPHMKNMRKRPSAFMELDLPDFIATSGFISVGEGGEQVYVAEYRQRIEARILAIVEKHPTLAAIRKGQPVTDAQLIDLERTLSRELAGGDIQLNSGNIRKAYGFKADSFLGFLRLLLELDAIPDYSTVVRHAFDQHITAHGYNADQIRFLRAVQDLFLQKRKLEPADLYEPPLTNFGRNAADRFFAPADIQALLKLTETLAA